jgi:hypothetical protein
MDLMQWEYDFQTAQSIAALNNQINESGRDYWELVSVVYDSKANTFTAFLKRQAMRERWSQGSDTM